jgi:hypothetical protein
LKSSNRKIRANRANARASTGPKTTQGRIRSARNAIRHGLSLPIYLDLALSEEVEALARKIAGKDANAEIQALARGVAEAQIDLRRVRAARHQLLSESLSNPYFDSRANMREKLKVLSRLLKPKAPEVPLEEYVMGRMPQKPEKLAEILAQEVRRLSAMDRHERRALSRRRLAIRAFDHAKFRDP